VFARGFDRDALRVVTWNLQLLPGAFAGQGGCPASLERRARRIVANVLALARATRVDVVAFQEVWHEGAARVLKEGLRCLFPHQHRPAAYCGLLTVTRAEFPHAHARFAPFRNAAGIEGWWFTKGVAAVVVERRSGGKEKNPNEPRLFAVLNAHFQSDFWASGAATRASQMAQTRALLEEIHDRASDRSNTIVETKRDSRGDGNDRLCEMTKLLVGDLNVAAGTDEYRAAMRALGDPTDVFDVQAVSRDDKAFRDSNKAGGSKDASQDVFTFPIGAYVSTTFESFPLCLMGSESFGAYVAKTPTQRLDYALRFPGADERRAETEKKKAAEGTAVVLWGLARGEDGAPLSDHAPVFAVVQM
jgi:endonuclease/exonuclease/phosphatase family metal-dependent hydrolase